jgi:hypothetical protein
VIRYSLSCVGGHEFEAWFSNSAGYDAQRKKRQIECPECGSTKISKQIMAPAIRMNGRSKSESPEAEAARAAAEIRSHIASNYDYVGDRFADEARAMFYGDAETKPMWGEVTPDVAQELAEEGVPAMPLPKPFAPTPPRQRGKLN